MTGISPDVYRRLRFTLLECGHLESDRDLRVLFVDARLVAWRNQVPENTTDRAARVAALIDLLWDRKNDQGESALALFLRVLSEHIDPNDACFHRLVQLAADLESTSSASESAESYYFAGARLQELRGELSLQPSEFAEFIGLNSEREYLDLESDQKECSLSLLQKIHDLTGAQLDWLKHSRVPKYLTEYLPWPYLPEALEILSGLSPKIIYLSYTSDRDMQVGICVQVDTFRYHIYQTGVWLAFWRWSDQLGHIPQFCRFLEMLHVVFSSTRVAGGKISRRKHKLLYEDGMLHPVTVVRRGFRAVARDWSRGILDIHHKRYSALHYACWHSPRFLRVQQELRKYSNQLAEIELTDP